MTCADPSRWSVGVRSRTSRLGRPSRQGLAALLLLLVSACSSQSGSPEAASSQGGLSSAASTHSGSAFSTQSTANAATSAQSGQASADAAACTTLSTCCHRGVTDGSVPISSTDGGILGQLNDGIQGATEADECLNTVSSGNAELCSLVLHGLQASESGPKNVVCGFPSDQGYPFPPAVPACVTLAACCSSITEVGGADACNLVTVDNDLGSCDLATRYFQSEGFCNASSSNTPP